MQNLKPISLSVFFFALAWERIFTKMHSIESICVIQLTGLENILFVGASMHLSAQKYYMLGPVKGLREQVICHWSSQWVSGMAVTKVLFSMIIMLGVQSVKSVSTKNVDADLSISVKQSQLCLFKICPERFQHICANCVAVYSSSFSFF